MLYFTLAVNRGNHHYFSDMTGVRLAEPLLDMGEIKFVLNLVRVLRIDVGWPQGPSTRCT